MAAYREELDYTVVSLIITVCTSLYLEPLLLLSDYALKEYKPVLC